MNDVIVIIEKIEGLLVDLKKAMGESRSHSKRKHEPATLKFSGLTSEIHNLVKDGYFKEPRKLSDIQRRLRLEGIKKPTTSLMRPLLRLLKKKVIRREEAVGGKGPFTYLQRGD
ncbi:MAG: hypothetical protein KKC80_08585 [Candidatus Margulisbacteria bacterium]|nr:hypothetical protein [Candidatus Margulisiibacteriota bacterium]MBU1617051.1 hypothetical protein [Candidatus Margulisiibacteriota bacterium]